MYVFLKLIKKIQIKSKQEHVSTLWDNIYNKKIFEITLNIKINALKISLEIYHQYLTLKVELWWDSTIIFYSIFIHFLQHIILFLFYSIIQNQKIQKCNYKYCPKADSQPGVDHHD